jgi:hypothetical protein
MQAKLSREETFRGSVKCQLVHFARCALITIGLSTCIAGSSVARSLERSELSCDESIKARFKPDDQTAVILVRQFKKGEPFPNTSDYGAREALGDLCLVKMLVGPGNPGSQDAPSSSAGIGIEVWLPPKAVWNGRLHAFGNGGFGGGEESDPTTTSQGWAPDFRTSPQFAAEEGAVTVNSDMGHPDPNGSFAMKPDGAINTTLWKDFSFRASHEQVVRAKALATAYYGKPPKYTYWQGTSGGGREGLKQAQSYPEDYDGILISCPAINWTRFITAELYPQLVIQRDLHGRYISNEQLDMVSNAAIAACDVHGGRHLGFILEPGACTYDPTKDPQVLCKADGGNNATGTCLTRTQALAVNKIWYGMTSDGSVPDPALDNGGGINLGPLHKWYGLPRGTNLRLLAGSIPFDIALHQVALQLQDPAIASTSFTNATGNGTDRWKTLTYQQLSNAFDRGVALQPQFGHINSDDPDLSKFKARGGKILHAHSLNDEVIPAQGSINYYERVLEKMGGVDQVQSFYRFFLTPGSGHGSANGTSNPNANPPAPAVGQLYKMLTDWVERGVVPQNIVLTSPSSTPIEKSLSACFYPKKIRYVSGDINKTSSFVCS